MRFSITNRENIWTAFGGSHPLLKIPPLKASLIQQYLFNKYHVPGDPAPKKISAFIKIEFQLREINMNHEEKPA